MTMQRPAYLDDNLPTLNDRATQGLGALLPPHISIRGNQFTLVDAAGNTRLHTITVTLGNGQKQEQPGPLDALVTDLSDHICKQFYANPDWTPDSNDPPDCWSANGVAPSRDAINPQARTCAECPQNVRGSRVSKMSGAAIKACRDEVWTALLLPQYPGMLFQLKILPGSFANWRAYCEGVKKYGDLGQLMTRISFEQGVNGVLKFEPTGEWASQALYEARKKALASKSTDPFVGRNDVPRQAIAAPVQEQSRPLPVEHAPSAGFQSTNTAPPLTQTGAPAQAASPSEQPAQQKRRRRTQAEIAADTAAQAQQDQNAGLAPFRPTAGPSQGAAFGTTPAPFAQNQPATPQAQFGIQQTPPGPTAEIEQALRGVFGS